MASSERGFAKCCLHTRGAAIIDSQTIKTTKAALDGPGFDGAKLITGRKGFIRVDVLGMLLAVFVSKGNVCRPRRHPTLA